MTATCYPVSKAVAQDMIQDVVHSICDRPGQTAAEREALVRQVVSSVMAFEPRDPVELMLAGMAVTNFHRIMDQTRDSFSEAPELPRDRANARIVALERATTGLLKEIRIAQNRPLADAVEAPRTDAQAEPIATAPKSAADTRQATGSAGSSGRAASSWEDAAPVPLLSPLRPAGASVAAMLASGPPPVKLPEVGAGSKHVATPPPIGARASQHAGAGTPENELPGLPRVVGTLRTASEGVRVAAPGA